jgi:hypothetical protein
VTPWGPLVPDSKYRAYIDDRAPTTSEPWRDTVIAQVAARNADTGSQGPQSQLPGHGCFCPIVNARSRAVHVTTHTMGAASGGPRTSSTGVGACLLGSRNVFWLR